MLRSREENFLQKCINFPLFMLQIISPWDGRESRNLHFSSPYIINTYFSSPNLEDATYQIWLRFAQWLLRRYQLTTDSKP